MSPGELLLILGALFVLGLIGLVLSVVMYGVQLLKWLGKVLFSAPQDRPALERENPPAVIPPAAEHVVCPRPNCGHVNRAAARFCAVCGCSLQNLSPVNAYG